VTIDAIAGLRAGLLKLAGQQSDVAALCLFVCCSKNYFEAGNKS
jgi:hypothetical protein